MQTDDDGAIHGQLCQYVPAKGFWTLRVEAYLHHGWLLRYNYYSVYGWTVTEMNFTHGYLTDFVDHGTVARRGVAVHNLDRGRFTSTTRTTICDAYGTSYHYTGTPPSPNINDMLDDTALEHGMVKKIIRDLPLKSLMYKNQKRQRVYPEAIVV
jgi:hypothetical protein